MVNEDVMASGKNLSTVNSPSMIEYTVEFPKATSPTAPAAYPRLYQGSESNVTFCMNIGTTANNAKDMIIDMLLRGDTALKTMHAAVAENRYRTARRNPVTFPVGRYPTSLMQMEKVTA